MMVVQWCLLFSLQTEEFLPLEEGEETTASQSMTIDQEVTLSQIDTPDQLSQEVIVIITDTESDDDQEEENEEEDDEQVEKVSKGSIYMCLMSFVLLTICPLLDVGL